MQYLVDEPLRDFEFWSGAKDRAELLTYSELDTIGEQLEDFFQETPTQTQINDLFWFDFDIVCSMLLNFVFNSVILFKLLSQ